MIGSRRQVLRVLSASALVLAAPVPALALSTDAARSHVESFSAKLIEIVSGGGSLSSKQAAFRRALTQGAAVRDIARVSIGRIWRSMPSGQKDRYVRAFTNYLVANYSKRFEEFSDSSITIGNAQDAGESGIIVSSRFRGSNGRPVEVEWRVIERGGRPKVFDVYIEGASLLITQKSEFESILDRNGDNVDALIREISS